MSSTTMTEDRISILKAELKALKQDRKEQACALKASKTWVSVKKRVPGQDSQKVIAWHDGRMYRCWFQDGKWFVYNGTYFLENKDVINDVSHWCSTDWMTSNDFPMRGPGIKNFILYTWKRFTQGASDMAYDLRPKSWSRGAAQLDKKIVYYKDRNGKLSLGLPEDRPAPKNVQKIVCNNVYEAEKYSELQRQQESRELRIENERRRAIEEPKLDEIRRHRRTLMENARNNMNRDFLRAAEEWSSKKPKSWERRRESFLHSEGYEEGR